LSEWDTGRFPARQPPDFDPAPPLAFASSAVLRAWQSWHSVHRLASPFDPPCSSGMRWSISWSLRTRPQHWQAKPSRLRMRSRVLIHARPLIRSVVPAFAPSVDTRLLLSVGSVVLSRCSFIWQKCKNPEARSYRGFLFERVPANLAGDCTGSNYGMVIANTGYICNGIICSGVIISSITSSPAAYSPPSATLSLSRSRTGRTEYRNACAPR
jgi:hypothetical protein